MIAFACLVCLGGCGGLIAIMFSLVGSVFRCLCFVYFESGG